MSLYLFTTLDKVSSKIGFLNDTINYISNRFLPQETVSACNCPWCGYCYYPGGGLAQCIGLAAPLGVCGCSLATVNEDRCSSCAYFC